MTTTINAKMNAYQQVALKDVTEYVKYGHYEIKECTVNGYDDGDDVRVTIETGMPNDEGTFAECLCRNHYVFHIGARGGLFFFDEKRDYKRHYIKRYEIGECETYRH